MINKLTSQEICKVLDSLIGKTEPVGDSNIDKERLSNLKNLIDVTNWCLDGIQLLISNRNSYEGSIRDVGETAMSTLLDYQSWLSDILEDEGFDNESDWEFK